MSAPRPQDRSERSQTSSTKTPFSLSLGGSSNGQPKKTSFNLQGSNKNVDSSNRALPRRPHHLHSDDESDDESNAAPAHEIVTGFDTLTGTAISAESSHEKTELVIPVAGGNNWRDRAGINRKPRGKNLLPQEVQAIQAAAKRGEVTDENTETDRPSVSHGLSFARQSAPAQDEENNAGDGGIQSTMDVEEERPKKPLTQDEIAMNALIRESKGEVEARSDLVIESAAGNGGRYDETTSFKADVSTRPESATLDQYNAIPVEEFGAALLRGMGWKDGQTVGRGKYSSSTAAEKPRVPERRPGFLGIGAKDSGKGGAEAELGAWGKSAMRKGSRKAGKEGENNTEGVYMPVMMRNRKTGEFLTEEELASQKKEAQTKQDDGWKERRDRNLEKSGRDRDRDRDRDSRRRDHRDDDSDRYDRRKTGSSRRDRSLSADRQSRQGRYDDDDRHYRDRDSDYDRERARDRDRDRDREKRRKYRDDDSRYSSSASSRHGRDRERDRGSDRDSYRRRRHDDR
ncbi:hypothetical protein FE257_002218 [Aspergillus nanangensis]|uniref:Pre-mRNA-splicing factor n=1 Tax=Aspergillus nanangensis TaxID=2582783 RepID=A0AAD4CCW3_ASPNN|nr:hypothetical protein FE257_002218 [Aspergillus nanangensis]